VKNQREQPPLELLFTQNVHGATSQKMAFFIVTAVKTSDLTYYILFYVKAFSFLLRGIFLHV
jgi:hypothetical protein